MVNELEKGDGDIHNSGITVAMKGIRNLTCAWFGHGPDPKWPLNWFFLLQARFIDA